MKRTRIKLVRHCSDGSASFIINQFPGGDTSFGNHEFVFEPRCEEYDWLVVIDNLPEVFKPGIMPLHCDPENTILVCTEPSSITYYGKTFAGQFKYLITNQDERALPHDNAFRTPNSIWFYGKNYDRIVDETDNPPPKTRLISGIATDKSESHTMHRKRFDFLKLASREIADIDMLYSYRHKEEAFAEIFGGSLKYVQAKHKMIDPYKYHLAIGNQVGANIITERILDSYLGYAVPISFGCTNLSDHFPEDSFIEIDISDPVEAVDAVKRIISDRDDYCRRRDSVEMARSLVLKNFNLVTTIVRIVEKSQSREQRRESGSPGIILSRRLCRLRSAADMLGFMKFKSKAIACGIAGNRGN